MTTIVFGNVLSITDSYVGIGADVIATSAASCVIGAASSTNGTHNVILGNGVQLAAGTGRCVVIGNNASCLATSSTADTILIGNGSATAQPGVCKLGGSTTGTFISDYGLGHFYLMPPATFSTNATLTGADVARGFIRFTMASSNATCYFPTAANIVAAMKDPVVGSGYHIFIFNDSSSAYTLSLNFTATGLTHSGLTTLSRKRGGHYYLIATNVSSGTEAIWIRSSYNSWR